MVKKLPESPCPKNPKFKIMPYLSGERVYIHCQGFRTCEKKCLWYGESNPSISLQEIQRLERLIGVENLEQKAALSSNLLKRVIERIMREKARASLET